MTDHEEIAEHLSTYLRGKTIERVRAQDGTYVVQFFGTSDELVLKDFTLTRYATPPKDWDKLAEEMNSLSPTLRIATQ